MSGRKATIKSPAKCKLLWNLPTSSKAKHSATGKVQTDSSWAYRYHLETIGGVDITIKAGNRDLALDGYSEESKTKISESLLRRRYR